MGIGLLMSYCSCFSVKAPRLEIWFSKVSFSMAFNNTLDYLFQLSDVRLLKDSNCSKLKRRQCVPFTFWAASLSLSAFSMELSERNLVSLQPEWTIWLQGTLGFQRSLPSPFKAPFLFTPQKSSEHTQGGLPHQQALQEAVPYPISSPVSELCRYVELTFWYSYFKLFQLLMMWFYCLSVNH